MSLKGYITDDEAMANWITTQSSWVHATILDSIMMGHHTYSQA